MAIFLFLSPRVIPDMLYSLFYIFKKQIFGLRPNEFNRVVNNDLWNAPHLIAPGKVGKLGCFDHIRRNVFAFNRHLMGQPGRWWAIRSAWRGENFYLNRGLRSSLPRLLNVSRMEFRRVVVDVYVFGERGQKSERLF